MFTSRIISDVTDLQVFADHFDRVSSTPVSLDYLRTASVRAFYRESQMIGGFVVNTQSPLRYGGWVPAPAKDGVPLACGASADSAEITCIWMKRQAFSHLNRCFVYTMTLKDAFSTGRPYILGGSLNVKVARIQRLGLPHIVYEGPTTVGFQHPHGQIYYGKRHELWWRLALGFITLTREALAPKGRKTISSNKVLQ